MMGATATTERLSSKASAFTGPQSRADLIDEYVLREAWTGLLYKIMETTSGLLRDQDETDSLVEILAAICGDALAGLERELWPAEVTSNPGDHPEYDDAITRSIALEAAILARLTTAEAQAYLPVEASRLAKLAADRLVEGGRDT
jgi:hypothetical protein